MKVNLMLSALLSCLLLATPAAALPWMDSSPCAQLPGSSIAFSYISVNEGLSSNSVRSIMQDRYGYIWIGTDRGLNRWDGYDVTFYRKSNGLPVTSLLEVGDTIWIGTESGLYLYSQRDDNIVKFDTKETDVDISSMNISSIKCDRGGDLWIASMTHGILRLDTRNGRMHTVPTPDNARSYACIFIDNLNNVWATSNWTNHKLVRFNPQVGCFEPVSLLFHGGSGADYPTLAITQGSDKHVWMATADGNIVRFHPKTLDATVEVSRAASGINNVHSIIEVWNGYFMIGSDAGLTLFKASDRAVWHYTTSASSRGTLSDKFVYPIMRDSEGGIWIGTFYGGVNYYHPSLSNFTTHVASQFGNSVSGNVINHFCEDRYHRIWIASDDGGLSLYDPETCEFRQVKLSDHAILNVHALAVKDDLLYVGTYAQGISIVDINTLAATNIPRLLDDEGKLIDMSSYEMMVDSEGRLWVGTFNSICLLDTDTRRFRVMHHVSAPVTDMLQTRDGRLWFATEAAGLLAYDSKADKWQQYDYDKLCIDEDGSMLVTVNCLYEDATGGMVCGTSIGLLRYDKAKDTFAKVQLPQPIRNVLSMTEHDGHLWLATNAGLSRYSVAEGRVEQTFKGAGYTSTDFLPGAMMRSSSGMVYVGSTHGFVSFSPKEMRHNAVPPTVRFTAIEVFNKRVEVGSKILKNSLNHVDEIRLSYRDNVIRLQFSALSYVQPGDNTYSYYMEGFDADWIDAGNHHSVTYTNLSPGTYTFHVRASNNDGVFSPDTTIRVVITPPWYWNTYARIIYILMILAAAYCALRRIQHRTEQRHKAEIAEIKTQKEQEIQEITTLKEQEIEELNTQKEQEIQEINTQKEQEIQEINTLKEQEVHEARIKFMTITPRDQEFLDRLEQAVEQNFSNPDLSVDVLAQTVGISRTGLFTKLKALADVTPNEMIQVIRLKHAATLLQENRYRVSEVCYMVGFSSPSYFSKCFQKQYGVTPAKFV